MVKTVKKRKLKMVNILGITLVVIAFLLLVAKHYNFNYSFFPQVFNNIEDRMLVFANVEGILNTCPEDEEFVRISADSYVCLSEGEETLEEHIFASYPASIEGKESVYEFLNTGSREKADKLVNNIVDLDRYEPVKIENMEWREDPYGERYWRFIYYSLRPTRHLLSAALETGGEEYYEKLYEVIGSFSDEGMDEVHSWDDIHGVAFRTMILTNTWWKLRGENKLPQELSDKIIEILPEHAAFLMQPKNFEGKNNHGITQAMALFLVGETFPDLEGADVWRETARERIDESINNIVDEDGALVENSPYYHYYALEKYWEIYKYFTQHELEISDQFLSRVEKMFGYATYVLQPDNNPPLIGASIPRDIRMTGEFREIAEVYPPFRYVLTQGEEGERPERTNIVYPSSGQVIMRSGWGEERPYTEETFLLFDMGPYRTDHSELDALNFHLYSKGDNIIRDTGLFTYEEDNDFYNYFYGTRGHNTVMVDGRNQDRGEPVAGEFREGEGWVWQSAYHSLYPDVVHHRAIALLEDNVVLIVDELEGTTSHTYEQLFHLAPGAASEMNGTRIRGKTQDAEVPFVISQIYEDGITVNIFEGEEEEKRGWCGVQYEERVACPEISYTQEGRTAQFATLITIGDGEVAYEMKESANGYGVEIRTENSSYSIPVRYIGEGRERQLILDISHTTSENPEKTLLEMIKEGWKELF